MPTVLTLPPDAFERLRSFLSARGYVFEERPHQAFLARGRGAVVNLYTSGKLVLGGANREEHRAILTEAAGLGALEVAKAALPPLEVACPKIGTDEVGKGDYFGPLVIAGCAVDEEAERWLKEWGVRDSKTVETKGVPRMAYGIRKLLGRDRYEVISISPQRYNQMYEDMGNLNRILAWGHARVVENLLERNPDIPRVVTDQFGDKKLVEGMLQERGRRVELIQAHQGERDPAVAAASVLARDTFLRKLKDLSEEVGVELPRGAVGVLGVAKRLIKEHGPGVLARVAKVHFRTTEKILGDDGK